MRNYRELIVWKKSMDLVTGLYKTSKVFPTHEKFGLTSQLQRCSVSIPSNIAEGFGRKSLKDFIRFLRYSMGSLFEFQTQIEIAYNLQYIEKEDFDTNYKKSREVEALLQGLINSLTKKVKNNSENKY